MDHLLKAAISVANLSNSPNFRHGAIIFAGGKVISSSPNGVDHFCHAETNAVRKLCQLKGPRP
jgi:deoxycytidylate deaminase